MPELSIPVVHLDCSPHCGKKGALSFSSGYKCSRSAQDKKARSDTCQDVSNLSKGNYETSKIHIYYVPFINE